MISLAFHSFLESVPKSGTIFPLYIWDLAWWVHRFGGSDMGWLQVFGVPASSQGLHTSFLRSSMEHTACHSSVI